ncbi:MAG: YlmC/YmxH family sporulation protein [Firmicutes bacterium]|nr:YlmC/YmxH family sporulation protein [Bacillota bacterium]
MLLSEFANKRIINIFDGDYMGTAGESDLLIDEEQGQIVELLLPPLRGGWFGAARQQAAVPWSVVKKIGSEVVVVDIGSMPGQNM